MFSVFSRDSRLLILPFSPLTLSDAIVISLFFFVFCVFSTLILFRSCYCFVLFLGLQFLSWLMAGSWVSMWFVVQGVGRVLGSIHFLFPYRGRARWCWYGHWSRLLIRFGLVFPRAGVMPFGRVGRLPFGRICRLLFGRVCRLPSGRVNRLPYGRVGRLPFGRICGLPFGRVGRLLFGRVGRLPFGRLGRLPLGRVGRLPFGRIGRLPFGRIGRLPFGRIGRLPFGRIGRLPFGKVGMVLLFGTSVGDGFRWGRRVKCYWRLISKCDPFLVGILDVLFAFSGVQFARGLHWWLPLALCSQVSSRNGAVSWLLGEGCGIGFFCGNPTILGMVFS